MLTVINHQHGEVFEYFEDSDVLEPSGDSDFTPGYVCAVCGAVDDSADCADSDGHDWEFDYC